jgi:hypothetical protein
MSFARVAIVGLAMVAACFDFSSTQEGPEAGADGAGGGDGAPQDASLDVPDHGDVPDMREGSSSEGAGDDSTPLPEASTGPTVLYPNIVSPIGITVHASDVCWVADLAPKGLFCAAKDGSGPPKHLDDASDGPNLVGAFDLVVDDISVYWSNGSGNQLIRKDLPSGSSAQYYTGPGHVAYLSIEATSIWSTDYVDLVHPGNVSVGPTSPSQSTAIYLQEPGAAGVAALADTVYWGRADALAFAPQVGNMPVTKIPTASAVGGVAVDAQGTVYFMVGNQQIFRLARGAVTPDPVFDAGSPFGDSDIAVDDTTIYWTEHDLGRIMRMAK